MIYIYQIHEHENLILAFIRELYDNTCCECDGARSGAFSNCATVSLLSFNHIPLEPLLKA